MQTINFYTLPTWQLVLAAMFVGSLIIHLLYYLVFFVRLAFYKSAARAGAQQPVSVIICAWNEEDNLRKNLQSILEQDYPTFEVIVVNDHSLDETDLLLQAWQVKYKHLRVVNLNRDNSLIRGKKFAISMGIKGAQYEDLIFTDADCMPTSSLWLQHMAQALNNKDLVLGFGGFEKKPGLLNKLYRYESVHIAMQYMSYALAGLPYMGVGRNLAYKKELFFRTKGFIKHRHIASGDDDLLVNEVATGQNTTIQLNTQAHTISAPALSFSAWWLQKRRHLSTGSFYKTSSKILLGTFTFTHLLFYVGFFALLSVKTLYWLALVGLLLKWVFHISVMYRITRLLNERDLLLFSLLGDLFTPLFNTAVAFSNRIKPPIKWR